MSAETLPEYPNLFELEPEKLTEIELRCQKSGHLDPNEKLLDRITLDLNTLKSFGLAKEDIYTNHRNMWLKFNKVDEFDAYTCDEKQHGLHANNLLDNVPKGFGNGWCLQSKTTNEITLNGQHLRITCFVWGGAEECAIEKSFTDKYNGYSRGDRDWFVTNLNSGLNIWIPDLLPAQISMFGFAQSLSSAYRLDPEKYIQIMGLDQTVPVIPLKSHKEKFWGQPSGPSSIDRSVDIIEELDTDLYHAICYWNKYRKDQKTLQIHFKDNNWIQSNKHQRIKIFDLELDVDNIFNQHDYLSFSESSITVLDDRDDSDSIGKKNREQGSCSIQ